MSVDWEERLAKKRAEKEAAKAAAAPKPLAPPEMPSLSAAVPQTEGAHLPEGVQESDAELDKYIDNIDILDAYKRWCGKMTPKVNPGQVESIMISCPVPGHRDNNPSAWVNTEKGLWHCMACGEGGDKLDIAAYHFGITDYKTSSTGQAFHNLRREIGKEAGWTFEHANGAIVGKSPAQQQAEQEAIMAERQAEFDAKNAKSELIPLEMGSPTSQPSAPVVDIETGVEMDEEDILEFTPQGPRLNWKPLVQPGTFLDKYMSATTLDSSPEEFHFWNGLTALSLAAGRQAWVVMESPFYSNLFICTLGKTGQGKSKSKRYLKSVLREALPYDRNGIDRTGAYMMPRAGSGEVIARAMKGTYQPPGKNTTPVNTGFVKAYIEFDEMSDMLGRSGRTGSTMKDTLQELFDCGPELTNNSISGGEDIAKMPFASLSTSTQPELLRSLLTKDDANSGFLNRFLFITGTSKPQPAFGDDPIDVSESAEQLKKIRQWCDLAGQIKFSDEAKAVFEPWWNKHLRDSNDNMPAIQTRIGFHIRKLILLFAINAMEKEISAESVNHGLGLYEYLTATYAMVDSKVSVTENDELLESIVRVVTKQQETGPKWVSMSQITRNKKWSLPDVDKAIKVLVSLGKLVETTNPPKTGKRGAPIKGKAYMPGEGGAWMTN